MDKTILQPALMPEVERIHAEAQEAFALSRFPDDNSSIGSFFDSVKLNNHTQLCYILAQRIYITALQSAMLVNAGETELSTELAEALPQLIEDYNALKNRKQSKAETPNLLDSLVVALEKPPRRGLVSEVGWLGRTGDYYPCNENLNSHNGREWHSDLAKRLADLYYKGWAGDGEATGNHAQEFLIEEGWLRTDVEQFSWDGVLSAAQFETLKLLQKLNEDVLPRREITRAMRFPNNDDYAANWKESQNASRI